MGEAGSSQHSLALAACGGRGDNKLGEQAQGAAENKADNMSGTAEDMMEAKADATREAGEAKEERGRRNMEIFQVLSTPHRAILVKSRRVRLLMLGYFAQWPSTHSH